MATEQFKKVTSTLFQDYLEIRNEMKDTGYETVKFDFRDYIECYIKYLEGISEDYYTSDESDEDFDLDEDDSE